MNRPTNNPVTKHWLADQFEKNLFAIIVGAAFIYTTSQTTDAVTANDIRATDQRLGGIEARIGVNAADIQTLREVDAASVQERKDIQRRLSNLEVAGK